MCHRVGVRSGRDSIRNLDRLNKTRAAHLRPRAARDSSHDPEAPIRPTLSGTAPASILETVRGYVEEGVTVSTVGFGMGNFNDTLMERLANDGYGNYADVDTLDEATRVLVENLAGMLQVIARDAKI